MDPALMKSLLAKEKPSAEEIKALPKVLLHEHLDGGLRPATIIDIAKEIGYTQLPSHDPEELSRWFYDMCNSGSLVKYLHCFDHTIAVMQRAKDLLRVARECVLDLAADGVIYAELRYAPELFVNAELNDDKIVQAIQDGFQEGMEIVNSSNAHDFVANGQDPSMALYLYPIRIESLLCSLRQHSNEIAERIADLCVKYRDLGVCGFDIAGPENGFPPHRHLTAFNTLRKENMHFTIHAGEDFGLPSIWQAIQVCGSDRLGHGVRLVDDIYQDVDGVAVPVQMSELENLHETGTDHFKLGRLAHYIRDKRITLEVCPTSNLQTGCVPSNRLSEHPIHLLHRLRFRITVNTDNRLMSSTSMSNEFQQLVDTFGWTFADMQRVTINAIKSAFIPFDQRIELIKKIIKPSYREMITVRHEREGGLRRMHRKMSEDTETDDDDDRRRANSVEE